MKYNYLTFGHIYGHDLICVDRILINNVSATVKDGLQYKLL